MPGVGDVAAIPLRGGYGACLVTGLGPTACALDHFSAAPPTLDALATARPLVLDHHALTGQPTHVNIVGDEPPPPWWSWLGRRERPEELPERVGDHAGWTWLATQIAAQRHWDRELPEAAKQAYRSAPGRGPGTAMLDLTGAGPAVRWSELDHLPRCTTLIWSGPDHGLREALATHPVISDLTWVDPPADIDLRGTGLTRLRIAPGEVEVVRLPDGIETLKLDEGTRVLLVTAADDGRWIKLIADDPLVPAGLGGLREVTMTGDGTISAAPLAGLSDLRRLSLTWRSAPGELTDATALSGLSRLADLKFIGAYGVNARNLPDLPALSWLSCSGIYRRAAAALEARFRDAEVRVDLSELEPEWREF
jgi:hypothetical protein